MPIFSDALPFFLQKNENKGRPCFHDDDDDDDDDDEITPSKSWDKTAAALKLFKH